MRSTEYGHIYGEKCESQTPSFLAKCGRVLRTAGLAGSLIFNAEIALSKKPEKSDHADVKITESWRKAGRTGEMLPDIIKNAFRHLPEEEKITSDQVYLIIDLNKFLVGYLVSEGVEENVAKEVVKEVAGLSQFTLGEKQFPIFVVEASSNYRQLQKEYGKTGRGQEQIEIIMASELLHERQHAAKGANEKSALRTQIQYLIDLRKANGLTIADKYINGQQRRLEVEEKKASN